MALIVEDGTAKTNADSYLSVADATTYWTNRNNSAWSAASTEAKEAALREATQYLDGAYDWAGSLVSIEQALGWPRYLPNSLDAMGKYVPGDVVPLQVKQACGELALEALSGRLAAAVDRGGLIKSESVGDLSVTYMDGAPARKSFPMVDMLVRALISGSSDSITVDAVRA